MRYTIIRDGVERVIEVERLGDGRLRVRSADGADRAIDADVRVLPKGDVHLIVDGSAHDVSVHLIDGQARCAVRGRSTELSVLNERALRLMRLAEASAGAFDPVVVSPMAGKIIAVEVGPGDEVADGDALVVIEAMKMENIIRAPSAARVETVDAAVGAAVEAGERLVLLAPLHEEEGP